MGRGPPPLVLVPCLGRSSAQGLPQAAVCPGSAQTSPGRTARCSRSPGCHRSCATGCRCLPADCSSPGCEGRQTPTPLICHPEAHPGAGEPQQETQRVGKGREQALKLITVRKASERTALFWGCPGLPSTCAGARSLPALSCQPGPRSGYDPGWCAHNLPDCTPTLCSLRVPAICQLSSSSVQV